jgi:hypothetical protein
MRRTRLAWLIAMLVIASAGCLEWQLRLTMVRAAIAGVSKVLVQVEHPFSAGLRADRHLSRKGSPR